MQILNAEEGIKRVVNNRALYVKLLGRFADTTADAPDKIEQFLAAGEREEAQRLAHTVKGSAANLSAPALADIAAVVEGAIHNGEPVDAPMATLRDVLKQTLDAMAAFSA